jgi:hypothetical protein
METMRLIPTDVAQTSEILRGTVVETTTDYVVVEAGAGTSVLNCVLIDNGGDLLQLRRGDPVLVLVDSAAEIQGVILGRISKPSVEGTQEQSPTPVPDELVIEAKKNLTIRCGEGSITIRGDGKVLIKGKDLVSHAQRMNRIKGGSVSIN